MNRAGLFKHMAKNRLAPVCAVILCVIVLGALLAPLSPYDPDALSPDKLMGPCAEHLLGTDDLGRDTFTRALYGGRVSLLVGFAAMAVAVVIGCLVGSVAGYAGGKVDAVLMRIVDVFLSVPSLLFIIVVYAFAPRNLVTLVFMLAFFRGPRLRALPARRRSRSSSATSWMPREHSVRGMRASSCATSCSTCCLR